MECQQIVNQSYQPPSQSSGPGAAGAAIGYMIGRATSETVCTGEVINYSLELRFQPLICPG
jgi:hypothetical protein